MSSLQSFFLDMWYKKRWWAWLLWPLSLVFYGLSSLSSWQKKKRAVSVSVPVVVIGNISVGGTGKTPVIIALVKALQALGIEVGVVSRGYGSEAPYYPYLVGARDTVNIVGDEPLLIAVDTDCPVVIGSDRVAAANYLIEKFPNTQLILSDDGLQHYRLGRAMEVVVIDGDRGLGNHLCLPAGPLREPASRLSSVDWILMNGGNVSPSHSSENNRLLGVQLKAVGWKHVKTQGVYDVNPLPWNSSDLTPIIAIAGIGHPQRFFNTLLSLGIKSQNQAFADHHVYTADDIAKYQDNIVLMTEKDAVKCQGFPHNQCWSLKVEMTLPDELINSITQLLVDE